MTSSVYILFILFITIIPIITSEETSTNNNNKRKKQDFYCSGIQKEIFDLIKKLICFTLFSL